MRTFNVGSVYFGKDTFNSASVAENRLAYSVILVLPLCRCVTRCGQQPISS